MAYQTLDFYIKKGDGWTNIATNAAFLHVRPSTFSPWALAVTASGAPASVARASGTITFAANPTAGETVTINGQAYTFVSALTAAFDVLIGALAENTLDNLVAAINDSGVEGTDYGTGTTQHPDVTAVKDSATQITVYAKIPGSDGNSITLAETSATAVTVSGANLTGGSDEVHGIIFKGLHANSDENEYRFQGTSSGDVYVRALHDSGPDKMHFGVIRDQ